MNMAADRHTGPIDSVNYKDPGEFLVDQPWIAGKIHMPSATIVSTRDHDGVGGVEGYLPVCAFCGP